MNNCNLTNESKNKTLEYFFIGWEESDSHDECVAKFGKWHVPEEKMKRQRLTLLCFVRVQMCLMVWFVRSSLAIQFKTTN